MPLGSISAIFSVQCIGIAHIVPALSSDSHSRCSVATAYHDLRTKKKDELTILHVVHWVHPTTGHGEKSK